MAIYPTREDLSGLPYAELRVYEALENLGNQFLVFHSVRWLKKTRRWAATWKENDFLILNKHFGALVLEVKGGDIEYSGAVFRQINTRTKDVFILDPKKKKDSLSQAVDGAYHYRGMLEEIGNTRDKSLSLSIRFPIEVAVWFPSCEITPNKMDKFPLAYREVREAVLDINDLKNVSSVIYRIFEFYGSKNKANISDEEFKTIVDAIAADFELITAPSAKKGELDYEFIRLTKEQAGILDYIAEQRFATIQGVAGTGKTLIAKEAAKIWGEEGHKVLFLCFNKFLYIYLRKNYPYENVTYYNIHSFIHFYSKYNGDLSKADIRAKVLETILIDELSFQDIIIDEAQDFHDWEINYFKTYAECKEGRFLAFFDKNQVVQTNGVPKWIENSECRLLLTKNCRNTYEIALTAYNIMDVELNQKSKMINGPKTKLVFAKGNPINQLVKLIKIITGDEYGYEISDIVILTLKTESQSFMNNIHTISGIPVSTEKYNSSILFTTAKKFKGLESRVVIIIDIDEKDFCDAGEKRNFYVACSRATQFLSLVIEDTNKKVKQIAKTVNGPNFAPQGKIAMKAQAEIIALD